MAISCCLIVPFLKAGLASIKLIPFFISLLAAISAFSLSDASEKLVIVSPFACASASSDLALKEAALGFSSLPSASASCPAFSSQRLFCSSADNFAYSGSCSFKYASI